MVIIAVASQGRPTGAGRRSGEDLGALSPQGGLDEPHAARNSQDASSHRSESEAWIVGEAGSKEERTARKG
jgi:hypothetical protein